MRFKGHMRKLLANGPQEVPLPTHEELERDCRDGKAVLSVNRINHREFVKAGIRYFVGYSSERDPNYCKKENPRLCRGGSRSLTVPGVRLSTLL